MAYGPSTFDPRNPGAYLARTRQIESGGRNNAVSPTGAAGPFQFTKGTARQYGLSLNDRFDPTKSAAAALRLAIDNANYLRSRLGRQPTNSEVYLAHQQGPAGAAALIQNPHMPAAQALVVGGAYNTPQKAAYAVRVNGGNPSASAQTFAGRWLNKFDGGTSQQYASATTPSSAGGSTPSTTPQSANTAQLTTPNTSPTIQTQTQFASATTPGSGYGGDDALLQYAMGDVEPPPQDSPQQQEEQQSLPEWQTPQISGALQENNDHPFIDSPPTDVGIDQQVAGRLAQGKQRMAQLGEGSDMGNLFADAYANSQLIGQAGKSQQELAAMLAAKNKNRSVASDDEGLGGYA